MKKVVLALLGAVGLCSAQFLDGDYTAESGLKLGLVNFNYDSFDGSSQEETLDEFISLYGYMGASASESFEIGASVELGTGSAVEGGRSIIYTTLELNPSVSLIVSDSLKAFTGFGGSLNRVKEVVGSASNKDLNFGLQFFAGVKFRFTEHFGVLGEYKAKFFVTGDYDGKVIHHFNGGVFYAY